MPTFRHRALFLLSATVLAAGGVLAQSPAASGAAAAAAVPVPFSKLLGRWVRPDGGYVIAITAADAAGKLEASYANPSPLPFYTAEATREGGAIKLYFELRAGGYNGSNYTLTYYPASDQLKGVYYQAVAKQKFDVSFARAK